MEPAFWIPLSKVSGGKPHLLTRGVMRGRDVVKISVLLVTVGGAEQSGANLQQVRWHRGMKARTDVTLASRPCSRKRGGDTPGTTGRGRARWLCWEGCCGRILATAVVCLADSKLGNRMKRAAMKK